MRFAFDTNVLVDVMRDAENEAAFGAFLRRFSHATHLSAVVMLELRAGARTPAQARALEEGVFDPFERRGRVFAPPILAYRSAGALLAKLADREGWTADAKPSLVRDALLAVSCRDAGLTLITRDRDFARFAPHLRGWRTVPPWPTS
ncbi:MAG: type II toxin-antitoxin system VapC family toxin [Vicinamibacteraceae bacterium]